MMASDLVHLDFSSSPRAFARPELSISATDLASLGSSSLVQALVMAGSGVDMFSAKMQTLSVAGIAHSGEDEPS